MALQASPAAPQALQRLMARGGWLFERLQQLGLQGQQNQRVQEQVLIINTINLLAILPAKVVLGCSYALVGLWLDTLLMGATFGLVVAFMVGHSQGKIDLIAYRQSTLIISFCCPFALTILLGGLPQQFLSDVVVVAHSGASALAGSGPNCAALAWPFHHLQLSSHWN